MSEDIQARARELIAECDRLQTLTDEAAAPWLAAKLISLGRRLVEYAASEPASQVPR